MKIRMVEVISLIGSSSHSSLTMMNTFGFFEVCATILFILLYFLRVDCNVIGEWEFQNLNPNLEKLHWKQLEKLTEEDRKRMCLEIYEDQVPPTQAIESYSADEEDAASNSTMKSATVLTDCQVRFMHALVPMSLIECDDKRLTFYLAQGDDKHVFMLRANNDSTYSFTGIMQKVTYPAACSLT